MIVEPWKRLASWAIDIAVLAVVVVLATLLSDLLGALLLLLGVPAYYLGLVGHQQVGTVGHQALGLKVIDERTGERVDLTRSALRLVVAVGLMIPFAIPAAASVWSLFSAGRNRTWHDLASQTVVVAK
jgi:uncharacterized RDD family membrane protein YckC